MRGIYLLTLVAISGHFTAYSYIEPFLSRIAGLGNNAITVVLTLFGAVGLVGSFIFSRHYNNNVETFFKMAVAGLCFCLLMLLPASCTEWSAFLQCMLWGLSINFFNLSFQSEIIRHAPQGTAVAMSIYSGIYNVGIGTGALVGGSVCDGIGIRYIGYVGGAIALAAVIYCIRHVVPVLRRATAGADI